MHGVNESFMHAQTVQLCDAKVHVTDIRAAIKRTRRACISILSAKAIVSVNRTY